MSDTSSETATVEIVQTTTRKRWTAAQKLRIVEESMQPGNSASRVATRFCIARMIDNKINNNSRLSSGQMPEIWLLDKFWISCLPIALFGLKSAT